MANPAPDPNFTGAQKDAYAKQYGGWWNGSTYNPTGTAPAAAAPLPKPAPIAPVTTTPAAAAPAASAAAQTTTGGSMVPQGVGATATTPQTAGGPTIQTTFRDQLLKLLNTNPASVSLTDPDLAPQSRAYADSQQRSTEQLQRQLAEQGFAGGALGTGAYDTEKANAVTQQGENVGQFNANLISNAQNQRLQTLMSAMGLGQSTIQSGDATTLQSQLGNSDIALRSQLGQGQIGLGLLQAMLGDRQANNSLGLNAALAGAGLNQSSILHMLGL